MKVSVIIPTYNRKELLENLLDSLFKQDYQDYEIIVVDDGSTDGTLEFLENLSKTNNKLKFIKQNRMYPIIARDTGIKQAKGEIVVFTDDDCLADKEWVKNINNFFEKNKDIIGSEGKILTYEDKVTPFTREAVNKNGGCFQTCNLAFRKSIFEKISLKDLNVPRAPYEEHHIVAECMKFGDIKFNENMLIIHPPRDSNIDKLTIFNPFKIHKRMAEEYKRLEGAFISYIKVYKRSHSYFRKYMGGTHPYWVILKVASIYPIKEFFKFKNYFKKNPSKIPIFIISRVYVRYLMLKGLLKYSIKGDKFFN